MNTNAEILKLHNGGLNYEQISKRLIPLVGELSPDAVRGRVQRMRARKEKNKKGDYETKTSLDERQSILNELGGKPTGLFKVGVLDTETTGLWGDFGYVLCAVIKDMSTNKYDVFRLDETKSYKDKNFRKDPKNWKRIDRELLEQFRKVYETYDIIVHFNGRWFDIQFLDTRLLKNKLPSLPDMKQIDILNDIVRKKVRIRSNRLDALKEFLEIDELEDGHRWEYWQMAANGQKEGFDYVVEHCKRDVDRLAEVAERVKSHIRLIGKW